jgi:hypothetical protein
VAYSVQINTSRTRKDKDTDRIQKRCSSKTKSPSSGCLLFAYVKPQTADYLMNDFYGILILVFHLSEQDVNGPTN